MCVYFRSHVHLHLDECPKRMMKCSVAGCNNFYQLGMENAHNELYQGSHQALLKSQVESLQRAIYDKVCWSHLGDSFSSITIETLFIQLEFRCFRFYLLLFLTFNNSNNNNNNIIIIVFLNIVIIITESIVIPFIIYNAINTFPNKTMNSICFSAPLLIFSYSTCHITIRNIT